MVQFLGYTIIHKATGDLKGSFHPFPQFPTYPNAQLADSKSGIGKYGLAFADLIYSSPDSANVVIQYYQDKASLLGWHFIDLDSYYYAAALQANGRTGSIKEGAVYFCQRQRSTPSEIFFAEVITDDSTNSDKIHIQLREAKLSFDYEALGSNTMPQDYCANGL